MIFDEWKKQVRAVTPKEQRERDNKNRNQQLANQYSITESFMGRLTESSGPIEPWERDFLTELAATSSWWGYKAKQRLLRA